MECRASGAQPARQPLYTVVLYQGLQVFHIWAAYVMHSCGAVFLATHKQYHRVAALALPAMPGSCPKAASAMLLLGTSAARASVRA